MTKGTRATQIRLTESEKTKIEDIRERFGLPSMAAAIRYAVEDTHRREFAQGTAPRKIRKRA